MGYVNEAKQLWVNLMIAVAEWGLSNQMTGIDFELN